MRATLTISLPAKIKKDLEKACRDEGLSRSDIIRESLRDYLFIRKFRKLREQMCLKAQSAGIFTDDDVFKIVS